MEMVRKFEKTVVFFAYTIAKRAATRYMDLIENDRNIRFFSVPAL